MGLVENFTDLNCRECVIWREEGDRHYVVWLRLLACVHWEGPGMSGTL